MDMEVGTRVGTGETVSSRTGEDAENRTNWRAAIRTKSDR